MFQPSQLFPPYSTQLSDCVPWCMKQTCCVFILVNFQLDGMSSIVAILGVPPGSCLHAHAGVCGQYTAVAGQLLRLHPTALTMVYVYSHACSQTSAAKNNAALVRQSLNLSKETDKEKEKEKMKICARHRRAKGRTTLDEFRQELKP